MLGGGDSAAEILLSFFYRYSTPTKSGSKARTNLNRDVIIRSEGGEADLLPVNTQACVNLFQLCFERLMDQLESQSRNNQKVSLVASIIDIRKLVNERNFVLRQAKTFQMQQDQSSLISATSAHSFVFSKNMGNSNKKSKSPDLNSGNGNKNVKKLSIPSKVASMKKKSVKGQKSNPDKGSMKKRKGSLLNGKNNKKRIQKQK
jgi:hypothetical protein